MNSPTCDATFKIACDGRTAAAECAGRERDPGAAEPYPAADRPRESELDEALAIALDRISREWAIQL